MNRFIRPEDYFYFFLNNMIKLNIKNISQVIFVTVCYEIIK